MNVNFFEWIKQIYAASKLLENKVCNSQAYTNRIQVMKTFFHFYTKRQDKPNDL